jgi:hypothetical protein
MSDPGTLELRNKEFELRTLKECIEEYFDMPKNSMLWRDFYRFYKERLGAPIEDMISKERVRDAIDDLSCAHAPNVCECCKRLEELKKELEL